MWNKNKSRNTFKIWGGKIMIKAMLADDHVLVREGIKHLLEYDGTVEVIRKQIME